MLEFIAGLVLGAGVMLLIYRNNKSKMSAIADKLNEEISDLKAKVK